MPDVGVALMRPDVPVEAPVTDRVVRDDLQVRRDLHVLLAALVGLVGLLKELLLVLEQFVIVRRRGQRHAHESQRRGREAQRNKRLSLQHFAPPRIACESRKHWWVRTLWKTSPARRRVARNSEGGPMHVGITVNGVQRDADLEPRTLLVDFIRDDVGLTGTKIACDTSLCGACTVHLDGKAVKSCTVLAVQADGAAVTTIEGLASNGALHAVQEAFREKHGLQCGYCTPGMIMAAVDLLEASPQPSDEEIRHALEGNLCRCTGYENIVRAVHEAAEVAQ